MITNRDVTDAFIEAFEGNKPFTPSEKRLMGIKLTQLRKSVKEFLKDNEIDTKLSINEIIMQSLEYAVITGKRYRSISSLGYETLRESIEFWDKRRKLAETSAIKKESKKLEKVIDKSYNDNTVEKQQFTKRKPKWLGDEEW